MEIKRLLLIGVTVAPDGAKYNLAYVTADDESMKVTGAYDFVSLPSAYG